MKIKDLATMAGNCRKMTLFNTRVGGEIVRQHLSLNGTAIFPLDGMQPISEETLLTIADVNTEAREHFEVTQCNLGGRVLEMVEDQKPDDVMAKLGRLTIKTKYLELVTVEPETGGGILFLPVKLLKPIKDREQPGFVIRTIGEEGDEQRVIIALEGWKNVGAFAPAELWASHDEAVELQKMARAANELALINAQREQDAR